VGHLLLPYLWEVPLLLHHLWEDLHLLLHLWAVPHLLLCPEEVLLPLLVWLLVRPNLHKISNCLN